MKTIIMIKYENGGKTLQNSLVVDSDDTIYSVMAKVEEMNGVPPVLQMLTFDGKSFYHDTPGTLAENKLVPTISSFFAILVPTISVEDSDRYTYTACDMLRRDTLRNLGFCVDDDLLPDASVMQQLVRSRGQKMLISLTDYIRKDGAGKKMMLVVEPGDTVASLKEQVQRRRRYPPAMQELKVNDADNPYYSTRRMDRLDATLADYNVKKDSIIRLDMSREFAILADREERGKVLNKEIAAPGEQQQRPPTRTMFVMTPRREMKMLQVDPDDTVYSVMAQIEEMTGVPPILQMFKYHHVPFSLHGIEIDNSLRIPRICNKELYWAVKNKEFYYDTPGTLADNKLVDLSNDPGDPISVTLSCDCRRGCDMLHRKTLRNLGLNADDDQDREDPSVFWRLDYPGQEKMWIAVTDHIRMDGGEREMVLVLDAKDTVASLMERVQRRRRYPVAMQRLMVRDADRPYMDRRMDKLDATLADYGVRDHLDTRTCIGDATPIKLYMDMEFAFQAHRERQKADKAMEITVPSEQQKLADDEK